MVFHSLIKNFFPRTFCSMLKNLLNQKSTLTGNKFLIRCFFASFLPTSGFNFTVGLWWQSRLLISFFASILGTHWVRFVVVVSVLKFLEREEVCKKQKMEKRPKGRIKTKQCKLLVNLIFLSTSSGTFLIGFCS